ncbi:CLUMA_CG015684, isoform A [Clunio marinus]|uniref:CLUMA_CG015684, isoform A n=1 Tax=Clunio marinus TaxID=568069 RepID=A0A1J1IQR9_9DIPT|nr:CLUMA_CG015684, isoform A [Clunio marinus]
MTQIIPALTQNSKLLVINLLHLALTLAPTVHVNDLSLPFGNCQCFFRPMVDLIALSPCCATWVETFNL